MTAKTAMSLIGTVLIVLLVITGIREFDTVKGFFYYEISKLVPDPFAPYSADYDIKGELKENCFFIFFPPDGGPPRNIQNSGPTDRSGEIMFTITDLLRVKPHFAYAGMHDDPPYWQWYYKFLVDPDGRVWVLQPKGQDFERDRFVCPPERP